MKKFYIILVLCTTSLFAQEQVRVMSYNFLKYPSNSSTRNTYLAEVVAAVDPDILVCQEIFSSSGVNEIVSDVLPDGFQAGTFLDGNGSDTDNAIFYKDSLIEFINHEQFYADPRKISVFRVKNRFSPDTLVIYGVHLKASSGSDNEARREDSAVRIRFLANKLSDNSYFMNLGDFNIYKSTEPAFVKLLDQSSRNYFVDPLNAVGTWNNNSSFRSIHTQCTRTDNIGDGGVTGGLDDRFDIILVSQSIIDSGGITLVPGSYTAFGNDGKHFNHSINEQPNDAVSVSIANALYYASDHLPVYADFNFENITSVENSDNIQPEEFLLKQNYPNPFNPSTSISFTLQEKEFIRLSVYDLLGREVDVLYKGNLSGGTHKFEFNGSDLPSGVYIYRLDGRNMVESKKMVLLK